MAYEGRTSTLGKIGKVVTSIAIGAGIMYGVMSHRMDEMRKGYESRIAQQQKNISDPNFLLNQYSGEIKTEGLKPREGCADPASIDLKIDANKQGACLVMTDLKTKTLNPVYRSDDGKIYSGNNVTGAIEDGKNKVGNFLDDLFH